MIFKRIVIGEVIPCKEKDYLMNFVFESNSSLSNLTKYLLEDDIVINADDVHGHGSKEN